MTIEKTTNIEHVLLAFNGDSDGSFKGAHVQYFTVIRDGDAEIARQPGRATTISEAAAAGFTWPAVTTAINSGLVLTNEAQTAQITELTQAKTAADAANALAIQTLENQIATLTQNHATQIATLTQNHATQIATKIAELTQTKATEIAALSQARKLSDDARDAAHTAHIAELTQTNGAQITSLTQDKTVAEAARDAANAAKNTAETARATALALVTELQEKLTEYESPSTDNGVPEWVYASQAYKALELAGKKTYVEQALAQAASQGVAGKLAKIDYEKSAKFFRNHSTIAMFIQGGLFTSEQMDDLFIEAAKL